MRLGYHPVMERIIRFVSLWFPNKMWIGFTHEFYSTNWCNIDVEMYSSMDNACNKVRESGSQKGTSQKSWACMRRVVYMGCDKGRRLSQAGIGHCALFLSQPWNHPNYKDSNPASHNRPNLHAYFCRFGQEGGELSGSEKKFLT